VEIVNLGEKFSQIHDYWNPRIAGELNDSYVKLVKLKGEFVWHHIVPRGVEHCPLAMTDEVHVVLLEPKSTLNTGNVVEARTVRQEERI
jgi:hypothetical protein